MRTLMLLPVLMVCLSLAGCDTNTTVPVAVSPTSNSPTVGTPAPGTPAPGTADSDSAAPSGSGAPSQAPKSPPVAATGTLPAAANDPIPAKVQGGVAMLTPENTKIQFIGKKPEGKHEGGFAKFSGKIELPSDDVSAAGISMEIEMDSTYSDDPKLTQHLLSPDFFGARTHPKSTFTSTSIDAGDSQDHYVIKGDLTLHGVTKAINFPAEIKLSKDESVAVRSQFTINRNDFGISYGPGKINDEVSISVTVGKPHK